MEPSQDLPQARGNSRASGSPPLTPQRAALGRAHPTNATRAVRAPTPLHRFWLWWLSLVAPSRIETGAPTPVVRTLARRQHLAAALLLALLLIWLLFSPVIIAVSAGRGLTPFIIGGVGLLTIAAMGWLIRQGWISVAATMLIVLIYLGFLTIQFIEMRGPLERATAFYLLVYPLLLAAALMPAMGIILVLVTNLLLMATSALVIWPPAVQDASITDALIADVYVWPIAVIAIMAVVAYVWTSGMQRATARAEFALSNAWLARLKEERMRMDLEHDAKEISRVLDAWANGNLGARVGSLSNGDLRTVALAMTSYSGRVRTLAKYEHDLHREQDAAHRLAEAILYTRLRMPATWPVATGLPTDIIIRAATCSNPAALLVELGHWTRDAPEANDPF